MLPNKLASGAGGEIPAFELARQRQDPMTLTGIAFSFGAPQMLRERLGPLSGRGQAPGIGQRCNEVLRLDAVS